MVPPQRHHSTTANFQAIATWNCSLNTNFHRLGSYQKLVWHMHDAWPWCHWLPVQPGRRRKFYWNKAAKKDAGGQLTCFKKGPSQTGNRADASSITNMGVIACLNLVISSTFAVCVLRKACTWNTQSPGAPKGSRRPYHQKAWVREHMNKVECIIPPRLVNN